MATPESLAESPPVATAETVSKGATESDGADWSRWLIVALLGVGAIIAYCDRTNISAALAYPAFIRHFQLSDIDRGLLSSAFFFLSPALMPGSSFCVSFWKSPITSSNSWARDSSRAA